MRVAEALRASYEASLTRPLSRTTVTSSMVSEVSATLVARITLRQPCGAGRNTCTCLSSGREAKMGQTIPGLKMVAANGAEIANLGQNVIRFNAIKPADFAGQPKR